jgi:hypothetical protein
MPSRARTRHHHAHRFSGGVDESPAFCCWVEPEVEADEAVDGAAAHAAPRPGQGRDNAKAGDDCRTLIAAAANGQREVAGRSAAGSPVSVTVTPCVLSTRRTAVITRGTFPRVTTSRVPNYQPSSGE